MRILYPLIILSVLMISCDKDDPIKDYVAGKNYYETEVEGDMREYWVHVPEIYDENEETPVVFMLHGTSGHGEKFYNISGWKELGAVENIITVYPSSWRYCIIDDGQIKNTTKWNIYPAGWEYCANANPRDDIKFLRQVLDEVKTRFNVNNKKIYLAGFSNGGAMAFRCAVEMSDVLAAVVESGGSYTQDSFYTPLRNVPVTFQLGNSDNKWFGEDFTYPMTKFDTLLNHNPHFKRMISAHTKTFSCEGVYEKTGDESTALIATFNSESGSDKHQFKFILVNGLGHNYPNGNNHPVMGAEQNWEWMKQYSLE